MAKDIIDKRHVLPHEAAVDSKLRIGMTGVQSTAKGKGYEFSGTKENPLDNSDCIVLVVYPGGRQEKTGKDSGNKTEQAHNYR